MKLLLVNAYFYPENIAFSHLERDILNGLIAKGHEISVVCPVPCRGISEEIIREYHGKKREKHNGICIHRYWAPREGSNPLNRAFRYFWCNLRGNSAGRRFRDTDLIFAVSTPPTQGYFAGKLAKKLGVPLVYSLQDVFPDSLVTTGLTSKGSWLFRIGARLERKTYALCARIIVPSKTIEANLREKGVDSGRLLTVSNWIDTDEVRPVPRRENRLFEEFGIDRERFTVVYAGNFGASQNTEIILEAARALADEPDIQFVLFGSGAEFESAMKETAAAGSGNIVMNPLLPPDRISEVYSMGDVALITCKRGVGKAAMPSKLWSIMACDTPIIASFDTDSELSGILAEAGAGICVEPEDPEALTRAIKEAYLNRSSPRSHTARAYVATHAAKDACVKKYVACIEAASSGTGREGTA